MLSALSPLFFFSFLVFIGQEKMPVVQETFSLVKSLFEQTLVDKAKLAQKVCKYSYSQAQRLLFMFCVYYRPGF